MNCYNNRMSERCSFDYFPSASEQAPVLLILHGFLGSADNWKSLARAFSAHFSVYTLDCRNHGRSFHAETMTYADMAEDVSRVLDDKGLDQVMIMGHSMGGKTVMQALTQFPERFLKAVIVDIAPREYALHHQSLLAHMQALKITDVQSRSELDDRLKAGASSKMVRSFVLKNLVRVSERDFEWRCNVPVLCREYPKIMAKVMIETDITVPACFIKGELSDYVSLEDEQFIKERFQKVTIETIPGAGHWVHADGPDLFLKHALGFLLK